MSNDELEFDVGAPTPAAKPQSKPAKQQENVAESEPVQVKKVVKQQESAVEIEAPQPKAAVSKPKESIVEIEAPQPKVEVSKPKESIAAIKTSVPAPQSEPAKQTTVAEPEDFYIPNTFDKLEAWIRGGKRFKFWLRLKAVCLLPFLLILIIFIIIYSVSLGAADKKIDRLMSEKEQTAAQLAQDSVKIDELINTVEKLKTDVGYLRRVNDKLKKQQAVKPTPKPAAVQKKK